WIPFTLALYEEQELPEARFVRAVDKLMPKLHHLATACADLHRIGADAGEAAAFWAGERREIEAYAGEFTLVMELYDLLCDAAATKRGGRKPRKGPRPRPAGITETAARE